MIGSNLEEEQSNWLMILINGSIDWFDPLDPSILTGSLATHGAPLLTLNFTIQDSILAAHIRVPGSSATTIHLNFAYYFCLASYKFI